MDFEAEKERIRIDYEKADKASFKGDFSNTLVAAAMGAGLAFWAYGTVAHAVLFGFVLFGISAAPTRVITEMRRTRVGMEMRELQWREQERFAAHSKLGRVRRTLEEQERDGA